MPKNHKQIVIVTGATGTIGLAICERLSASGYNILAITRDDARGKRLIEKNSGSLICYRVVDVSKSEEVANLFEDSLIRDNNLACVVTCAGILKMGPSENFDVQDWKQIIDTNTSGTFYVFQQAIQKMQQQASGGTLIAIGSRWDRGAKKATAYAASKAALQGMITSLQKELVGTAIRPILVSPGSVASLMSSSVSRDIDQELLEPDDIAELITYIMTTPPRVIFNEITMQAYGYDLTDEYAE